MCAKQTKPTDAFAKLSPDAPQEIEIKEPAQAAIAVETKAAEIATISPEAASPKFNFCLVVSNPFWGYVKGQIISDDGSIQKIIDGNRLHDCRKTKRG
jgi:hypothetical protein